MAEVFTLLGFVAHLHAIERDMERLGPEITRKACEAVCAKAKEVIGTYDFDWPQLAPATIAQRVHQGFAANEPLLRIGSMRDSITWTADGLEGCVGSDSEIAAWMELGTSRAPPRSFLVQAAIEMEPKIHKAAARATVAVLMGRGLLSAEMHELMELLHLVKETAHQAAENLKPLVSGEDQEERHR